MISAPRHSDPLSLGGPDIARVLGRIAVLLEEHTGLRFDPYRIGTMEKRVRRRMERRRIETLTAYVEVLQKDPAEVHALCDDLLIGYTRFFRDRGVFDALSATVIPGLLQRRGLFGKMRLAAGSKPLRVWVAGCSTGEEAYSLAILLLEALGSEISSDVVRITGTDLSMRAIATATAGVYPSRIEADVNPERLDRFFERDGQYYRVKAAVRDCCVFVRQDIFSDPPLRGMDLISCRNVLIYLDPKVHPEILETFHGALAPQGILVLGTSESAGVAQGLFTPIDRKHRIYGRL